MTNHFPYFTEIEDTFVRCRGKSLMLSSRDWALMDSWERGGIPLHIVLRTIEDIFKTTDQKPTSLAFCKSAVEREFQSWAGSQVGKSNAVVTVSCSLCNDTREVSRKPVGAVYDWQLEFVPCEVCQ